MVYARRIQHLFWCSITRSTKRNITPRQRILIHRNRNSEINYARPTTLQYKNIVRLHVSMNNPITMQEMQPLRQILEQKQLLTNSQFVPTLIYVIAQINTAHILTNVKRRILAYIKHNWKGRNSVLQKLTLGNVRKNPRTPQKPLLAINR